MVAMVYPDLMVAVEFLALPAFKESAVLAAAQVYRASQAFLVQWELLVMTANSALQGSQVQWVPKETLVPTDLQALWARPVKMATTVPPAVLVVVVLQDTLGLKALKVPRVHQGRTALFGDLLDLPAPRLKERPPRLRLRHQNRKNQKQHPLPQLLHPKHLQRHLDPNILLRRLQNRHQSRNEQ